MSRELDADVAEKVFGYDLGRPPSPESALPPGRSYPVTVPHYSTDISAAWLVVEKCGLSVFQLEGRWFAGKLWEGTYFDNFGGVLDGGLDALAEAPSAPEAICRAALKPVLPPQQD